DKLEVAMPECQVESFIEFIDRMIGGISDMLVPIKYAMLGIVIVVNILIVVFMQKMFLVRERGEMAMLKSIGFSNGKIINWQTKRIAIALFLGVVIGTLTGTPFSQLTSGQVFKMMGASRIEFQINVLEVYVIYPLVIFATSVLMCMVTMLSVRKITVNDMNEIE
ncbi:MAG: ABC transporter permease, partial [Lachnospiraceae bacterium]|nr:ABC transporter permease [Lachnospiraceae bacterium]